MSQLKTLRPVLLSALLTGVPVLALFMLQWRFMAQLRTTTAQVLRQANDDATMAIAQRIQSDFRWPAFNLLERIDHRAIRELRFADIAPTIDERSGRLKFIDRVFVWSKAQSPAAQVASCGQPDATPAYFLTVRRSTDESAPREVASCDQRLGPTLLARGLQLASLRSSFTLAEETVDAHAYQVVYHFLYDRTEERLGLSAFVGFTIDSDYLRAQYFPQVVSDVISKTRGDGQLPTLAISIVDDGGRELYQSGRSLLTSYDGIARFPYLFFDPELLESLSPIQRSVRYWAVRSGYADGDVATFVQRQTRPQQALVVLMAFVAMSGVGLMARAAAREARLTRLRSDFMASASHELQTPLAKIQLFAETLEAGRSPTPERTQEYYAIIRGQALKLGYLIGMMLDFAKIEAGAREYPLEETNLRSVLESTLASFDEDLALKGFTVERSFPVPEVPVQGNSEGLQQLFGNLISNAIKYSADDRYLFVSIRTEGRHAVVSVIDHGIGIARREHRRIFRKFYRAVDRPGPRVAGSGLGLAIVAHIARAHRATVTVDSEPGRGAVFIVRIPLVDEEEAGR